MDIVTIVLQLIAIFLIARGAIVLALAGFQLEEARHVQAILTPRLAISAGILFVLALFLGLWLIFSAQDLYIRQNKPQLTEEQNATFNKRYAACMDKEDFWFVERPHKIERPSRLDAASRKCVMEAIDEFYKDQGVPNPYYDASAIRTNLVAFLSSNKRATAAFLGLLVSVPFLMWKIRDVERLNSPENRKAIITRAIWHLYIGTCVQLGLAVVANLS